MNIQVGPALPLRLPTEPLKDTAYNGFLSAVLAHSKQDFAKKRAVLEYAKTLTEDEAIKEIIDLKIELLKLAKEAFRHHPNSSEFAQLVKGLDQSSFLAEVIKIGLSFTAKGAELKGRFDEDKDLELKVKGLIDRAETQIEKEK